MATLSQGQQPEPGMRTIMPYDPNLALTYDPHAPPERRQVAPASSQHDRLGTASGWVSTGFGLFQLLAPRAFLRAVGMPYPPWLIRIVGARDLLLGLGLLGRPESPDWRRARFVNDMLDTTLIGAAYARSPHRGRLTAFAAVAAAVVALDARTSEAGQQTR